MGRPTPNVLFSESFRHYHPGEHVDEVRFSEPVVITACEILEQQTASLSKSVSLTGVSSPQSFSVEIFVRSGGDARFKRLCHAFLYCASASTLLDAQLAVTDHLVLRGTYDSLTLVVYGNLASSTGPVRVDRDLDSQLPDLLPKELSWRVEDLPEALHPQSAKPFGPLKHLQLIQFEKENSEAIQKLLQLAGQIGWASSDTNALYKVVKSLVSAAASLHITGSRLPGVAFFEFWPPFPKSTTSEEPEERKGLSLLLDAKNELCELFGLVQQKKKVNSEGEFQTGKVEQDEVFGMPETSDSVLELILHWIQGSVRLTDLQTPPLLPVESLIGGLAAAQLLCTDARECYRFVLAGGLHLLLDVLQHVVGNFSATTLLALGAVDCASRYAFGCEALLGWWTPDTALCRENWDSKGICKGYAVLIKYLLRPQQRPIVQIAARVIHRIRAYELSAAIQPILEIIITESASTPNSPASEETDSKALDKATVLIKQLVQLLTAGELFVKEGPSTKFSHWLALDGEDGGTKLPPCATYGATASTSSITSRQDIDPYLLSVLQERRLLPMVVALLSAPRLTLLQGKAMKSVTELVGAIEALLLALLSCRSGKFMKSDLDGWRLRDVSVLDYLVESSLVPKSLRLLFLAHDPEVSQTVLVCFQRLQELHEKDLPPLRHTIALTTAGFLCNPHDLRGMFQTRLSVMSAMDRLLGAGQQSEDSLWALWDLCSISRLESGREALLMLTWFPEVMTLLAGSFHSAPEVSPGLGLGEPWWQTAVHFVAEVLRVVVSDAAASTVAAWTPHAVAMQQAILAFTTQMDESLTNAVGDDVKDGSSSGLLEWLDSAVVYHKKGGVGLLKHASAILSGASGISSTASGLLSVDSMDVDAAVVDQAINNDLGNAAGAAPLAEKATVQMTVAFRILALVCSYPGVATVLYGEGAMAVVGAVLDQCSAALQSLSSAYDATMDEDDIDFDSTAEDLWNHSKEHNVLRLLLPTVLFLLALLQNLQVAVENFQNTKLVDVLLLLHRQMSSRIASYVSAPPYAWSGITQDFIAVRQVLASVLVCWPIFGWTPSLFPRLLGLDESSTLANPVLPPMEPAATCSILSLLVDMLPTESPQLCNSESALSDMYRSLAIDNILGCQSASAVRWYFRSPHPDEFMKAFALYVDQIGEVVSQNTSTVCGVLQDMLKLFIIRLACISTDHAATILRSILNQIREKLSALRFGSEKELLEVEHVVQLVAGLALHPASKAVLLREGVIEILLNACVVPNESWIGGESSSSEDLTAASLGRWLWIARAFTALCDPDISLDPVGPLSRRIMEDCPNFGDCCSIVSSLMTLLQVVPVGKDFEVVLEALEKLSSHKVGRTAIGYASVKGNCPTNLVEEVATDVAKAQAVNNGNVPELAIETTEEHQSAIFWKIWRRVQITLDSGKYSGTLLIGVIRSFAKVAIVLSAAGKSTCGVAALSCLLGIGQGFSTEKSSEEKLEPVDSIAALMKKYLDDDGAEVPSTDITCLSSVPRPVILEAHTTLMTMLRITRRAEIGADRIEKAIAFMEGQTEAFAAHRTSLKQVKRRPDRGFPNALVFSTKVDVESEKDDGNFDEFPPEKRSETSGLDPRGVLVWECPAVAQDRQGLPRTSSKRKAMPTIEVSRKRPGMDISGLSTIPIDGMPPNNIGTTPVLGRPFPAYATSASVLNRRDTFRQRKPNTSRPPSMHVDDYVARERSDVVTSGSSPAPIQRSTSGSGRPPSIHVDEFMAKQQERQQLSVTSSGIDDHQFSTVRHASLSSLDLGRRSNRSGLPQAINKMLEEEGQRSTTPQDKCYEQQWEEVSVAESAAVGPGTSNDVLEPSHPSASAPSTTADGKSEKTSSSSSSISTTTDSVHSVKPPQVADMLLLQSKVTLQTIVARNLSGAVQTQAQQEVVQTVSVSAIEQRDVKKKIAGPSTPTGTHGILDKKALAQFQSWTPEPQSNSRRPGGDPATGPVQPRTEQASDSQAATNLHSTGGFTPLSERQMREAVTPMRRSDSQNPVHISSVRETRQHPSARLPKEPTTPLAHGVRESQASTVPQPSPYAPLPHHTLQAMQMNSPVAVLERRPVQSTSVIDQSSCPSKGAVSTSYATDPRPRPPEKHGERTLTDFSRQTVPRPPASPWRPDAGQTRLESTLPLPLASVLSGRQNAAPSLPGPAPPQWPPGEAIAKGTPLSNTSETPWPVHVPNAVYVDDGGIPYGMPGRSAQPSGNPPLPVGHSTPHLGTTKFQQTPQSPLSPQMQGVIASGENVAGPALPGSHSSPRGYSPQLQGFNTVPSLLQPMSYIPPPLPAGRPTIPHAPSLPVNSPAHQQQLHLHFQQQNIIQLQQQQLQARQHQLLQHAQPQQVQQVHHQQHLLGPLPMSVQVPLQVPPPPPPAPPAPPGPPPPSASASTPPQQQQRSQQQESSAMLQQVLASPDGIQALLKDQNKLRELLEKHPKLISLLQEKMSQAPP